MDTHTTDRAEIQVEEAEETLSDPLTKPGVDRLASFRSVDGGERPTQETPAAAVRKRRRNGLMVTACSVGLLAGACGVFWISPYNHYSLADASRIVTQAKKAALSEMPSMSAPGPVAPAARLARAPEPTRPVAVYRGAPPFMSIQAQPGDDMAEFLKLGGQGSLTPAPEPLREMASTPAATPQTPTPDAQARPAVAAAAVTPQARQTAASPTPGPIKPIGEAAQSSAPAPTTLQRDAVTVIAALRPTPMTEPQQVQVLDLVAQLGTLVRDQRAEIAQLRQDQQNVGHHVDAALADFGRRISLSEARRAVSAAGQSETSAVQPAGAAGNGVTLAVARSPLPAAAAADAGPHRYHVQAASPGLAMLSELDRSGGEERQLPVSPGDDVPGWGKVVSISQRGTTWTVKTGHGLIQ